MTPPMTTSTPLHLPLPVLMSHDSHGVVSWAATDAKTTATHTASDDALQCMLIFFPLCSSTACCAGPDSAQTVTQSCGGREHCQQHVLTSSNREVYGVAVRRSSQLASKRKDTVQARVQFDHMEEKRLNLVHRGCVDALCGWPLMRVRVLTAYK